jgi:DNA-binding GntR family transcriptional regulator
MQVAEASGAPGVRPQDSFSTGVPQMLSLPEQIADRIGDRILAGGIEPGARITELEMVAQFQVSRAPIRVAFRILERRRLIRIHPRRGVTVTLLTRQDLADIFDISIGLYHVVGRKLGESRSPAAIAVLEKAIESFAELANQTGRGDEFAALSFRTGLALVHAVGNPRLEEIIHSLALESFRYRRLAFQSTAHRSRAVRMWRSLLAAIRRGDGRDAGRIIAGIVEGNRDAALKLLQEETTMAEPEKAESQSLQKPRRR